MEDCDVGYLHWRGPVYEGPSVYSGMENFFMAAEQKRMDHEKKIQRT